MTQEPSSTYLTIHKLSEGIYKEKASKFIGLVAPCYSEAEAKTYLDNWKNEHHKARHLCYAYRFGIDGLLYRANDDGEPSNSAGQPILGQIDSFELTNVLIGVIRYYGGVKLGVGGLINAYRSAAKAAIENGVIVERELFDWYELTFDYKDMPHVLELLKQNGIELEEKRFEENCQLKMKISLSETDMVLSALKEFKTVIVKEMGRY